MYFFLWFFMTWFFFFFLCRLYSHSWSNILVNRFAKSFRSWIPVIFLTSVLKSRYACFLFLWQAQLDLKKAQQQVWMVLVEVFHSLFGLRGGCFEKTILSADSNWIISVPAFILQSLFCMKIKIKNMWNCNQSEHQIRPKMIQSISMGLCVCICRVFWRARIWFIIKWLRKSESRVQNLFQMHQWLLKK